MPRRGELKLLDVVVDKIVKIVLSRQLLRTILHHIWRMNGSLKVRSQVDPNCTEANRKKTS